MEHLDEARSDESSPTHEYPDPDCAAYVTKYPWFGAEDDYVPPRLPDGSEGAWRDTHFAQRTARTRQDHALKVPRDTGFDPDYEVSDTEILQVFLTDSLVRSNLTPF